MQTFKQSKSRGKAAGTRGNDSERWRSRGVKAEDRGRKVPESRPQWKGLAVGRAGESPSDELCAPFTGRCRPWNSRRGPLKRRWRKPAKLGAPPGSTLWRHHLMVVPGEADQRDGDRCDCPQALQKNRVLQGTCREKDTGLEEKPRRPAAPSPVLC